MQTCFYLLFFFHIAEGCTITDYKPVSITVSSGGSVELPCSCADPKDKTSSLTWSYRKKEIVIFSAIYPTDETNRYRGRVQLVDGAAPGHFTIVISNLTVVDGGMYRCRNEKQWSNFRLFDLTVEAPLVTSKTTTSTPKQNGGSKTTTSTPKQIGGSKTTASTPSPGIVVSPERLPFVPFALVTVIFLHFIVAVVYCRTRKKDSSRVHFSRAGDGSVTLEL
ncbi:hypothetical protein AMELA_G00016770 [Ameiurus melas]|uniref:Ig-like domain-containing protein n=1 Tax=Ameiurus melas TaxID=219545 RepID=A0A7J6BCJ2_AMEME|nr:hypothetical protein AMELA_G00016770 [Ameiurus melas]